MSQTSSQHVLPWLAASVLLAGAASAIPWAVGPHDPPLQLAFALALAWGVVVACGLAVLRWRGLWLLLSAPLALLWPLAFSLLFVGCSVDVSQCP